jgi:hypothetical protein
LLFEVPAVSQGLDDFLLRLIVGLGLLLDRYEPLRQGLLARPGERLVI